VARLHFCVIIAWDLMDKNNKSYTLIEILIVTAITLLLSGMSLVMMGSYKDDRLLNSQVNKFSKALEFARDKAMAGDTGLCSANPTPYVNGYSVVVNPTEIQLIPGCNTSPSPVVYPLERGIIFVTPSLAIQFDSQRYQGNTIIIPIKNTTTNRCKSVTIDETGLVTNADSICPSP